MNFNIFECNFNCMNYEPVAMSVNNYVMYRARN